MSRLENFVDRVLQAFVRRVPGRVVALTALVLYFGGGLGLPLLLHWSTPYLIEANVIFTLVAGLVALAWLMEQIERRDRRHLVEWTTDLRRLDAEEFEWLVGELFRREGWQVRETGHQDQADGNVDLVLSRAGERRIVQCKRWTARLVGVDQVRGFAGTLHAEGPTGVSGTFVTLSDFTDAARATAERAGISLIAKRDLYERMEKARRTEPCPVCRAPMLLDRSRHGWWFRCVTEGCSGKRHLGAEPGRALDLLTEPPPSG